MTVAAEPLTVFAVVISTSQLEIALPWMIVATVVAAVCWVLIAVDMRRLPPVGTQTERLQPVDQPEPSAR
jgi:hypothetical protein